MECGRGGNFLITFFQWISAVFIFLIIFITASFDGARIELCSPFFVLVDLLAPVRRLVVAGVCEGTVSGPPGPLQEAVTAENVIGQVPLVTQNVLSDVRPVVRVLEGLLGELLFLDIWR